jgi:sugar lactone lactonase YvrE
MSVLLLVGGPSDSHAAIDADQDAESPVAAAVEADPEERTTEADESNKAAAKDEKAATDDIVRPTHKQTITINVNQDGLPQTTVSSFCLTPAGQILAACGGNEGEVRIFDADGAHVESWKLPVNPEAINVGSDGNVYIAGAGKLLRLDAEGKVLHEAEAPHAADLLKNKEALRKEIIDRSKQMASQFGEQIEQYDKQIAELEAKQKKKEEAGEELSKADKRRLEAFAQTKKQYEQIMEQVGGKEPTEQELDAQMKASLEYKLKIASISETDGKVYIACSAAVGYGFNVWQLDENFENGKVIVSELRGCCGQMDVQAAKGGIFVAENARHRVCCYDEKGEMTTSWGAQARAGIDGFGSCCNPMNVAFGADGSIYTAESEIGRIKRFSPKGELIELVGKVDIVPGCKKVSIAVDKTGDTIFMLDVSRNHIVKMERLAPGEEIAYFERRGEAAASSSLGGALMKIFTGN